MLKFLNSLAPDYIKNFVGFLYSDHHVTNASYSIGTNWSLPENFTNVLFPTLALTILNTFINLLAIVKTSSPIASRGHCLLMNLFRSFLNAFVFGSTVIWQDVNCYYYYYYNSICSTIS